MRPAAGMLVVWLVLSAVSWPPAMGSTADPGEAAMADHSHHHHAMTEGGVVMNENTDELPRGCDAVTEDVAITIEAGRRYADGTPGAIFGMSEHEVRVPACSRVTVTFVNEDEVRHQWMVHGLPKYLYPAGMFHVEAMGGRTQSGTFIVPAEDRTYLIHCDLAQHMEKGMRGQLIVGSGSGDLWAVTGLTDAFYRNDYLPDGTLMLLVVVLALALGFGAAWWLRRPANGRS